MSHRYSFRPLAIDSGGHLSLVALDPTGQKLMAGGDIQGFFISEDGGDHWRIRNRGIWVDSWHRVASVLWSTTEANTIYAAVGDLGTSGGFLASTDNGNTWTRRSASLFFAGNHAGSPLPDGHPRSTGTLLAQGGGKLYAGSYSQGVFSSSDNGNTWTNIGFSGGTHYVRGIALDPSNADVLYVALYGERIWKTSNAGAASPSWTELTNAPLNPEEVRIIGGTVYAACNTAGVWRSTDGGSSWDDLSGNYLDTTTSKWMSLDGYVSGTDHVVIAGCADPVEPVAGQGYRALVKLTISSGGAVSYAELGRDPSTVSLTIAPDNRSWWRDASTSYKDWLSGRFYNPSCVLIDPNNTDRIWVGGSNGVFRSLDGGATWQLAVNGMPLSANRRVSLDPNHPLRVLVGNTDWTLLEATDGYGADGSTADGWAPSSAGVGYDVAVDPTDSTVFLAVGDRDSNIEGAVFSQTYGSSTWTNEGLEEDEQLTTTVTDTFTRSATDGWGTADSGQVWTVVSGPAANLSVNGSQGLMQLAASSASRSIFLQTTSILDCTGTFDVSFDRAATGTGGHFAAFHVRTDGTTSSSYAFRIDENVAGTANIRIHRIVSTATQIGSTADITGYTPTAVIHVRYRISGTSPTTLNMKAWVGTTEPTDWMVTISDSEATLQDAGSIALRAGGTTGYTAAAICQFDNLQVDTIGTLPVNTGGKRPLGLAVGRDGSSNRVLLAAVQESGLWRKVSGTWTRVDATICAGTQSSRAAWFAWEQGSQYVYVFDRASGIYRSDDYGATWTLIWNVTSDVGRTGFMRLNPAASNELWVSTETALYRLAGANTGTVGAGITATTLSGVSRPSAIAFTPDGVVFCVSLPDSSNPTRLLRSADNGTTWQDVSDESFKAMANRPADIAVTPTGRIYFASLCDGILIGNNIGQQQIT